MGQGRVRKFVIDRSRWVRGSGSQRDAKGYGESALLNGIGRQCCLGFVCEQLGVPREELLNITVPSALHPRVQPLLEDLLLLSTLSEIPHPGLNSNLTVDAMRCNDVYFEKEFKREALLREIFAVAGYEIEFVGEDEARGESGSVSGESQCSPAVSTNSPAVTVCSGESQ